MKSLLLMLLILIPFAGCKAGQGDRCAKSEDCGSGLVCFTRGGEANDAAAEAFAISSPRLIFLYKSHIKDPIVFNTCVDAVSLVEAARAVQALNEKDEADRAEAEAKRAEAARAEAARAKAEAEAKAAKAKAKAKPEAVFTPDYQHRSIDVRCVPYFFMRFSPNSSELLGFWQCC